MSQLKARGYVRLATTAVCFGAALGLTNEPSQSAPTPALTRDVKLHESGITSNDPSDDIEQSDNQPPFISVTSPASESSYPDGAAIPFSATASDPDGTVDRVSFYVDFVLYSTKYSSPYGIWLPEVAPGVHTLTVVAWDNAGASTTSAAHTLIVNSSSSPPHSAPPMDQPPLVSITAPSSEAAFTAPASITVSASAGDDGTIARVDFYANETLIATTTSSPYSFSWSGVDAGSYSLTAIARDDSGNTTASSTRDIIVRAATLPNTAVFVPASDHETAVYHYVLDVFPSGADPTVANSVLSVDLGKPTITEGECRVDISTIILGLAPGDYIATVTAVGGGTSAPSVSSLRFTR